MVHTCKASPREVAASGLERLKVILRYRVKGQRVIHETQSPKGQLCEDVDAFDCSHCLPVCLYSEHYVMYSYVYNLYVKKFHSRFEEAAEWLRDDTIL